MDEEYFQKLLTLINAEIINSEHIFFSLYKDELKYDFFCSLKNIDFKQCYIKYNNKKIYFKLEDSFSQIDSLDLDTANFILKIEDFLLMEYYYLEFSLRKYKKVFDSHRLEERTTELDNFFNNLSSKIREEISPVNIKLIDNS